MIRNSGRNNSTMKSIPNTVGVQMVNKSCRAITDAGWFCNNL